MDRPVGRPYGRDRAIPPTSGATIMKIALNGASGYTGRLAVAELARRDIDAVLVGRDRERLRTAVAGTDFEIRIADVTDPDALETAFADVDAVVNTAGPFARLGAPVVRAAIAAGAHYVDTTGEQQYVNEIFETFADAAGDAGVTVVPATADDGGPSDFIGHLVGEATTAVDTMTVALWYRDGGFSRGTIRSLDAGLLFDGALRFENGAWTTYGEPARTTWLFPGADAPVGVSKAALPPVATVPRHVPVRRMEGLLGGEFDELKAGIDPAVVEALPDGPGARSGSRGSGRSPWRRPGSAGAASSARSTAPTATAPPPRSPWRRRAGSWWTGRRPGCWRRRRPSTRSPSWGSSPAAG
ncbi:hypothetical protein BJF90_20425 [Pseudonocardia sp. CNS-004]|nr:hypothetical protein BJF90_20425 [Pseudonocardia sp. CNS-004]